MTLRCMLVMADGAARRVGQNGVLIGRQDDCDVVSPDPAASRRHAFVRVTSEGPEVVPLGRGPIEINGKAHERPCALADGDQLAVPGVAMRVQVTREASESAVSGFVLARERGGKFGIVREAFSIGGEDDDLVIESWPRSTLTFHVAQGELLVELRAGEASVGTEPIALGTLRAVAIGERVSCRGETFTIEAARDHATTTAVSAAQMLPTRVKIEMLPRGGIAVFTLPEGEHTVFLADRRFDLLIALLHPPGGYVPGEYISDDAIRAVVWPRNPGIGRQEINVLISRIRRDLVDAGLHGPKLIQRAPGGGGTRFILAHDASIVVKQ